MVDNSAPSHHSTAAVHQNDVHISHLATLLTTFAIASGNPKCTARVAVNAIVNIIHTINNRDLSRSYRYCQRSFTDKGLRAVLTAARSNDIDRRALCDCHRGLGSRCDRHSEVLRQRLLFGAVTAASASHVGDDSLCMDCGYILAGSNKRNAF